MALQYSTTHRTNAMTDIATQAGGTAYIIIYTGSVPANCATAATGTQLVALPCAATAGTASSGVFTFGAITTTATTAAGTAGYWRLCTSNAGTTVVAQGTVGTSGSDLNFAGGVAWTLGENISISSWTITAFGA